MQEEAQNILEQVKHRIQEVMDTGIQVKQEMMNILEEEFHIPYYKHDEQNTDVGVEAIDKENIENEGPNRQRANEKSTHNVNTKESVFKDDMECKTKEETSPYLNRNKIEEEEKESQRPKIKKKSNCEICQRTFKNLRKHVANKDCLKYYSCSVCGMKFGEKSKLKRHSQENKKSCLIMNGEIDYEAKYMNIDHKAMKTNKSFIKSELSCRNCERKFKNLKHLQNHTVKRTCLKVHVCEKCGKSFTLPSKLKRHIQEIKRECTDKIECQTCGKTFKVRRDLNRHKKRNNCIPYLTYF